MHVDVGFNVLTCFCAAGLSEAELRKEIEAKVQREAEAKMAAERQEIERKG